MAVDQSNAAVLDFAERWVGRWNAHDVGGILALVSPDVTWSDPSIDGAAHGLDASRQYIESVFRAFPDIPWTMPEGLYVATVDGAEAVKVAQPWCCHGTVTGP